MPETETPAPEATPNGTDPAAASSDGEKLHTDLADARREAQTYRHELRELRAAHEALQRQHETEQEKALREVEERVRGEVTAAYESRLATSQITAMATGRFADPADVPLYLNVAELTAETDEGRRAAKIGKLLDQLLEAKPHLAAKQAPSSLISQGGRSTVPDGRPRERSWLRG